MFLTKMVNRKEGSTPNKGKIRYLPIGLLMLIAYSYSVQAQQAPVIGQLVGVTPQRQPCLSLSEHAEIQQLVQTRLNLLYVNNPGLRKAATHPTFSFPLRWAKERQPYGFWSISNYVDLNPSIGPDDINQYTTYNLDYNCGNRTYDQRTGYQHQGTDIELWPFSWSVMAGEYAKVVAAAPGIILYKSDGNDDQSCGSFSSSNSNWNAVYVRHDDGSVAWYGHLKKQSLTPKNVGQRVNEGEFLGFVGSSGRSSGPHLHFEVYNADGKLIDPFQGVCNSTITDSWWKEQPVYKDKTINRLSVHLIQPVMGACPASANLTNEVLIAQPGQRFYFYSFGRELETNDPIKFDVFQPDGQLFTTYQSRGTTSYRTFYWYIYTTIPASAPTGQWKFRTTFNGKVYEKPFIVAKDIQSVVQLTPSGKTSFCKGDSVTLTANIDTDQYIWKKDGHVLDHSTDSKIVVYESGSYTAEINGAISNSILVTALPAKLPTARLTGNQTIYEGQSAKLSVAFTGDSPWNFSYRDSTTTGLGNLQTIATDANPYAVEVKPLKTTAYLLMSVDNACGAGTLTSRLVVVNVTPLLSTDDPALADAVEVYPVPATTTLTVQIKTITAKESAWIELLNESGRRLSRQETRQPTSLLQLDAYPPGTYTLHIRLGGRTATKRVVKY